MSSLAVSAAQAAGMLGVHVNTVYEMCGRRELRCARIGRRWVIPRVEVSSWLSRMSGVDLVIEAALERYELVWEAHVEGSGRR